MSAATLRAAASLLRERAEAATPGPWEVGDFWHIQGAKWCRCDAGPLVWSGVRDINGTRMQAHVHRRDEPIGIDIMQADASDGCPTNVSYETDFGPGVDGFDAAHIAALHPAVALTLADWLEGVARRSESGNDLDWPHPIDVDHALAVARLYIGEQS